MKKQARALIDNLYSTPLSEVKRALSCLEPPYPAKIFDALSQDNRAGAKKLLEDLRSKQRAYERKKRRIRKMLLHERQARADGYKLIAGVDEVGRGPLAGPVVAAAVILPEDAGWAEINDSKLLNDEQRREALTLISAVGDIGIGVVSVEEIDRINIHRASLLAFRLAIEDLGRIPDVALIDGRHETELELPQRTLVKGDKLSLSIAAASIVAKVARDQMMLEFDKRYPQYGFAKHKGYATSDHLASINNFGICPIHRRSFASVRESLQFKLL